MLGSSVYFFDALPSAQCVDRSVVHVRTDCHRLCQQSKAGSAPLAPVKPMWPRPRSLPPVRPNKGSLREEYLAAFGFSDCRPPFLAATELPSIKVSSPSINLRHTRNHVPSSSQRRHQGQQIDGLGYVSGKSGQPVPERKSQRMPSNS